MAITAGQVTLTGSAQEFVVVPPGPCTLIISNTGGAAVTVGTGSNLTTGNGITIPNNAPPVAVPGYPGSAATQLYVIGTAADTVCWMLSTPQ